MSEEIIVTPETQGNLTRLQEWAGALVVRTAQDYEAAAITLKDVAQVRRSVNDFFDEPCKKSYDSWKSIVARKKLFLDRCDTIERAAKGSMLKWKQAEDERARKEQDRLRREAEDRAEKERARLLARATKAEEKGKADRAEDLAAQAAAVMPVVPVVQAAAPQIKGVSTRKTWQVKSIDKSALIQAAAKDTNLHAYLVVDETALRKIAVALKGEINIPGVTFEQVEGLAIGSR